MHIGDRTANLTVAGAARLPRIWMALLAFMPAVVGLAAGGVSDAGNSPRHGVPGNSTNAGSSTTRPESGVPAGRSKLRWAGGLFSTAVIAGWVAESAYAAHQRCYNEAEDLFDEYRVAVTREEVRRLRDETTEKAREGDRWYEAAWYTGWCSATLAATATVLVVWGMVEQGRQQHAGSLVRRERASRLRVLPGPGGVEVRLVCDWPG
jgi:hypothetical protein